MALRRVWSASFAITVGSCIGWSQGAPVRAEMVAQKCAVTAQEEEKEEKKDDAADAREKKQLELQERVAGWDKDADEKTRKEFLDDLKSFFAEKPTPELAKVAEGIGRSMEQTGDLEMAAATYQLLGDSLDGSDDETATKISRFLKGASRRINLVGTEVELSGKLLDGEDLDWAPYKGKIVLIDFWATWCPPCVFEIPNLKKDYERFHDKGFEVIGISLDQTKEPLEKFIKEQEVPWSTIYERPSPLAIDYGVVSIPLTILLDRDGKVLATNLRGEELTKKLEKLFGESSEEEAEAKAEATDKE